MAVPAEDQAMELEALQSIYFQEFQEISSTPPISFQLNLTCDASVDVNREQRPPYDVRMRVKFPEAYPNEVPEVALESDELDDARLAPLKAKLDELAEENKGMAMIYTLASYVKEWLDGTFVEDLRQAATAEIEAARRQEEEEERRLAAAAGTAVTEEVFFEWKRKFDAEMAAKKAKEKGAKVDDKKKKLTGRQLFETDASLITSDQIEEGDEVVEVDASLFENLEDLEADEEEEDRSFMFADDD